MKKREILYTIGETVKFVYPLWKTLQICVKKLKIELPYDSAIPLLGMYLKKLKMLIWKDTCTPVFRAALFIWYNCQDVEVTYAFIERWMDKENVVCVCVYNWILCAQSLSLTLGNPMGCSSPRLLCLKFFRQEYWRGLPFLPPRELPHPEIESESFASSALSGGFFTLHLLGNS